MPIAQLNIAKARWPLADPRMAEFVSRIDAVNAAADEAPGFLWRLKSEDGGGSSYVAAFDDPRLLVNLSAWTSVDALRDYIASTGHRPTMSKRGEWFEPGTTESIVWDIGDGHKPSLEEALGMLEAWRQGEGAARDLRKYQAKSNP